MLPCPLANEDKISVGHSTHKVISAPQPALKEWIGTSNDFELNCFRCFSCLGISHGGRIQKGSSKDNRQSSRKNSDAGERQNFIEWKKLCSHDYLFVLAQSWSNKKTKRRSAPKRSRAGFGRYSLTSQILLCSPLRDFWRKNRESCH